MRANFGFATGSSTPTGKISMHDLISCFENRNVEEVEIEMCEAEEVAINQEDEALADIVANFAELLPELTGENTRQDAFEVHYQGRTRTVKLEQCPADEDNIRRAIRDIIQPDYEIRVLRSCLGTDTLAFVIDTPEVWQRIDKQFPEVASQLLTPFVDEIRFT